MFHGLEIIHCAGGCQPLGVDRDTHRNLHINATVVAMGLDGLWNQKNGD